MRREVAAFLRGISNVPMGPYRDALTRAGLADVVSFGATGNLMFNASDYDAAELEQRIAKLVGTAAFVRSRGELTEIVGQNPFRDRAGAAVLFMRGPVSEKRLHVLSGLKFEGDAPVVVGDNVYFVHPTQLCDRKSLFDFERELGVQGTMRGARVVGRVAEIMSE